MARKLYWPLREEEEEERAKWTSLHRIQVWAGWVHSRFCSLFFLVVKFRLFLFWYVFYFHLHLRHNKNDWSLVITILKREKWTDRGSFSEFGCVTWAIYGKKVTAKFERIINLWWEKNFITLIISQYSHYTARKRCVHGHHLPWPWPSWCIVHHDHRALDLCSWVECNIVMKLLEAALCANCAEFTPWVSPHHHTFMKHKPVECYELLLRFQAPSNWRGECIF